MVLHGFMYDLVLLNLLAQFSKKEFYLFTTYWVMIIIGLVISMRYQAQMLNTKESWFLGYAFTKFGA